MNENLIAIILVAVPFIIYELWATIKGIEIKKDSFFIIYIIFIFLYV